MKKTLIIATDTTARQTNGVVRTLDNTIRSIQDEYDIRVIDPSWFTTVPLPIYREVDIAVPYPNTMSDHLKDMKVDHIHIATEGPVGLMMKTYCDKRGLQYTTSFHSLFPEFIQERFHIPSKIFYPYFRWFHDKSASILVPTEHVKAYLERKGFKNVTVWSRGVSHQEFNPSCKRQIMLSQSKIILTVCRVSKEKGLDDFCEFDISPDFVKVIIGDGPYLNKLKKKYQNYPVIFLGKKTGFELAKWYASADVFVFTSRNDTFGLTQLESMASGVPVVAYRGTVSEEIIETGKSGILVDQLSQSAIDYCMTLDRELIVECSQRYSWAACSQVFKNSLIAIK